MYVSSRDAADHQAATISGFQAILAGIIVAVARNEGTKMSAGPPQTIEWRDRDI